MSITFAIKILPITQSIMVKRACKIPVLSKPKYITVYLESIVNIG